MIISRWDWVGIGIVCASIVAGIFQEWLVFFGLTIASVIATLISANREPDDDEDED